MATAEEIAPKGRNRIVECLPEADRARLGVRLEPVRLELTQVLYEANRPIDRVYFPLTAVASLLTVMEDGAVVEVGTVGNEGMVGLPVFLGSGSIPGRAVSQIPGDALSMPAAAFREEANAGGALQRLLQRYTQGLFNMIAQGAACNRLHPMEERCARWLLMTHDRVEADEIPLTHEFLSQMLGVRRATVTVALGMLQKAGLIRSQRGRVAVLDRPGLEAASCECYRIVRDEFDRLLG
jgi:CRP-like cAMP-binding protein